MSTRSTSKKAEEPVLDQSNEVKDDQPGSSLHATSAVCLSGEPQHKHHASQRTSIKSRSSTTSIKAKLKRLEYNAAQAKARISLELIDKKLEADKAQLEENYSSRSNSEGDFNEELNKWLQSNENIPPQPPPECLTAPAAPAPPAPAPACPPPLISDACPSCTVPVCKSDGPEETIRLLTATIRELAVSTTAGTNAKMLSRLSTPRDLPAFNGDPLHWIEFKQAFEESTEVCHFTERENLWRLRKCLHGPAKDAVTALLISGSSPATIISTLELQFGNPDVIISRIMRDVNKLRPLPQDYHREIVSFSVQVRNYVAAVTAIGQSEYLQGMNIVSVILTKLPTVLISKWTEFSYPLITSGCTSKLAILAEFLTEEALKTSRSGVALAFAPAEVTTKRKPNDLSHNRSQTVLVNNQCETDEKLDKCKFCRKYKHKLSDCTKFKRALRKDRWQHVKQNGLCFKCINKHHDRETCPAPVCDKDQCGQSHHRLLHYPTNPTNNHQNSDSVNNITESIVRELECETVTLNNTINKVLLKTLPIIVHGPNGAVRSVALLDDGSTVSLISAKLASQLGLRGHKQTMRVFGAWDNNQVVCDSEIMNFTVSNRDGTMFTMCARSVNELNLPIQITSFDYLKNNELISKLKTNLCDMKPELLIGQDNYHLLIPKQIHKHSKNGPYETLTPLGWCVHGRVCAQACSDTAQTSLLLTSSETNDALLENERVLREIHEDVRRSFTIESMGISFHPRQNSDDVRAWKHLENTSQLIDGRWHVGLPWKDVNCKMPESYSTALKRFRNVEHKMNKSPEYAIQYKDRIQQLLTNNYAEKLSNIQTTDNTWYLPHFGVSNPNKKKLRLVFDAASKSHGLSLNDYLLTGPDLLESLYGIMLRFREKKIGVAGDIRDFFLRVKINTEDQNALRFLWRDRPEDDIQMYAMTSLIFGASCSPFVAQFIKNKNALRYESSMPAAVNAICKQHYMDDYIDCFDNEKSAIETIQQVIKIHKEGGFEMTSWSSNSERVINSLPTESLGTSAVKFKLNQQYEGERTLGLIWFPKEDTLGFDVSFKRIPETIMSGEKRPTKREMLRVIMSLFDVYGFLSPFTIKGKILLQDTWKAGLSWDDTILDNLFEKWSEWLKMLKHINTVRLPRHYYQAATRGKETAAAAAVVAAPTQLPCTETTDSYRNLQLHVFCDSSTKAMCAVAYWRWINNNGYAQIAFISSKCRVAPVKHVSVPRLELQAALLAARLANTLVNEHTLKPEKRYFWCDSTTVLNWIHNTARNYKVYVAHRLGEIDELTTTAEWRYVPTKMNVSDIATRDTCELRDLQNEWLYGPTWLYGDEKTWPSDRMRPAVSSDVDLECVTTLHVTPEYDLAAAIPNPERFSKWLPLLKSTCYVLSFIDKKCKQLTGEIDRIMMNRAEQVLLRFSQAQSFSVDLEHLQHKKSLPKTSKLLTLTPILDEHGVLRVGGRIDAASNISLDTKQPVILDGRNYIARLIVRHYHERYAHVNQETVVNELKQKYWIIKIRPTVKSIASQCMYCRIRKAIPRPPRMGDLPAARMAHHQRPFTYCGVDLFGPMEVVVGRRRERRYGVLFTCLTVRAIHIETVSDLTTDTFIMALRRMAARRGWPLYMYSDNGTNLKGASSELQRSIKDLDEDKLKQGAIKYGTTWQFISPNSPHQGGAWERLIRSVKVSLNVVLNERAPRDEVLHTLLTEVENMVNSRPLTHVSVEPHSDEALTPNHFLLGSSSNLPTLGVFDDSVAHMRKRWRVSQALAEMFWRRWVKEVLPEMRPRPKWNRDERPIQVGDLVLIVDPNSPRNVWPKGIIHAVMPGKDGRIRVVDVKTKSGVLRRSVARVAYIPIGDECKH